MNDLLYTCNDIHTSDSQGIDANSRERTSHIRDSSRVRTVGSGSVRLVRHSQEHPLHRSYACLSIAMEPHRTWMHSQNIAASLSRKLLRGFARSAFPIESPCSLRRGIDDDSYEPNGCS